MTVVLDAGEEYEVCNVVGSSWDTAESMKNYWTKNTSVKWPQKCQIEQCDRKATGGGHMWVKRKRLWFILPICQNCNTNPDYDDAINQPGYTKTKRTACLVSRDNQGCKRLGNMQKGDFLWGKYDVKYDPKRGSPGQPFWVSNTKCNFPNTCQIAGCGEETTGAGRMKVKQMHKFRFLLPICDGCKKEEWMPTKAMAKLVAVD